MTMEDAFTVKDISRLFGLSESRIRYWSQTGFIGPSIHRSSRRLYSFSDLIGIKVARDLLESGLSLQRVRKNLASLRALLPDVTRPLSRLRVQSDGERMWVHAEEASFDATSGQMMLELSTGELQDDVVRILDLARPPHQLTAPEPTPEEPGQDQHPHRTAYRWFLTGLNSHKNRETLNEAMDAYRRALDLDPSLAAAHTNLGIGCFDKGDLSQARVHFERALALDPDQPEARYNLANLYEQESQLDLAIAEFRRVVASRPEFADAHFNLAIALEKVGSRIQSADHFRHYLALSGEEDTVWARLARGHIDYLDPPADADDDLPQDTTDDDNNSRPDIQPSV